VNRYVMFVFQLVNGSRKELSGYCPIDLFSG